METREMVVKNGGDTSPDVVDVEPEVLVVVEDEVLVVEKETECWVCGEQALCSRLLCGAWMCERDRLEQTDETGCDWMECRGDSPRCLWAEWEKGEVIPQPVPPKPESTDFTVIRKSWDSWGFVEALLSAYANCRGILKSLRKD